MNVDDIKRHYKVTTLEAAGKVFGKTKGTMSNWNSGGIPPEFQAVIQVATGNELTADLDSLKLPATAFKTSKKSSRKRINRPCNKPTPA
ncbi:MULTISPECIES: hypothetical protein [unclassified Psychrobacter]|uniref:hypothetical protein n=1 Tax=unclassified Psychrobacter TaxID=196806 RepID=UPI0018F3612D|nr:MULTISPECIES: hypothetical protein [unclassified Psychrobacter]